MKLYSFKVQYQTDIADYESFGGIVEMEDKIDVLNYIESKYPGGEIVHISEI